MPILVEMPWIALVSAGAFGILWAARRTPLALIAAIFWALYFFYELGMKLRILCSGECNIRVDLLLIHPALVVMSIAAIAMSLRSRRGTSPG